MATQNAFVFLSGTVTAGATAVSLFAFLVANGFTPTGSCVSLSFYSASDLYVGNASTITEAAGGALLAADTPFTDSATGMAGNTIPLDHIFVFKQAAGDATISIFARFIP